jgi:hypothetical protein
LDVGTIDSAWITLGTISYATITATSVGTAFISISTIGSCTISFGTITNLTAITENVSTLNITSRGSIEYATISAAGIGGLYVSSGTLGSCTITSGVVGALSVTSSTISTLQITTPLIGRAVITVDNLIVSPVGNWLPNPGFEEGSGEYASFWTDVYRVSPGRSGNYCGSIPDSTECWASVTIPTTTNEIFAFKGSCYRTSAVLPSLRLKVLDYNYNPISTLTKSVPLYNLNTWEDFRVQATITTSGAFYIVPGLYSTKGMKFDDLVFAKDVGEINIGDGQITAPKIAAGQVTTDHIRFNTLTTDPIYEAGKMWYRSDLDELRFASGASYDKVMQIPKVPLGAPMRCLFWFRSSWKVQNCEYADPSPDPVYWRSDCLILITSNTANSEAKLIKQVNTYFASWNKKRIVSFLVKFEKVAYTKAGIYTGIEGYPHLAVYFDNNSSSTSATLYGKSSSGTSSTTISLGTVSEGNHYLITIEFVPGAFEKFYVNNFIVVTITNNLPTGTDASEYLGEVYIKTYVSDYKWINVYQAACIQEL